MAVAGDLVVNLTGRTGGLKRSLGAGRSMVGSFVGSVTGALGKIGLAAQGIKSIFGALKGVSAPIKLAADLEQTQVSFEVLTGSAKTAATVLGEIQEFAASTPFQFPQLAEASKKLIAFGFGAGEVVPELRKIGELSAGLGIPIGELAEIYGKARVQGRLFGEDVNQLTGRGIPIIAEFAKQFGVSNSQVKKLVTEGKIGFPQLQKAITDMTGEQGKFGGLMQRQSGTLNGLWSTLKDNVTQALTKVGQVAIKAFDFKAIVGGVTKIARTFEEDWLPTIKMVVDVAARWFQSWWIGIKGIFKLMQETWAAVMKSFGGDSFSVLSEVFDKYLFFMRNIAELFQLGVEHVKLFGRNSLTVFTNLFTNAIPIFKALAMAIVKLFGNAFKLAKNNAKNFLASLKSGLTGKGFGFKITTSGLFDGVGKNLRNAGNMLGVGVAESSVEIDRLNALIKKNEAKFNAKDPAAEAAKDAQKKALAPPVAKATASSGGGKVTGLEQGTSAAFAAIFKAGRSKRNPQLAEAKKTNKKLDTLIMTNKQVKKNTDGSGLNVVAGF